MYCTAYLVLLEQHLLPKILIKPFFMKSELRGFENSREIVIKNGIDTSHRLPICPILGLKCCNN